MPNRQSIAFIIILLSSLIFPYSCVVNDRTVGDDFVSGDYILKLANDEFALEITTAFPDSVLGYSNDRMVFGYLKDETFGYSEAATVSHVLPAVTSLDTGLDPVLLDSYIYLEIDSTHVNSAGQEGILQNLSVYRLNKAIDSCTMHNTSFSINDVIGAPISVGAPVYNGGDSIKIHITEEFAKELLRTTYEESNDNDLFKERIKGIYLSCGDIPQEILPNGGRMNFIPLGYSRIGIKFSYTDKDNPDFKQDSTINFYFGAEKAINLYRSGSQNLASDELGEKVYVEGQAGVKPVIKYEFLKKTFDKWMEEKGYAEGSIVVSRASIILPFEMPEDYSKLDLEYPAFLYPCINQKLYKETQSTDYFNLLDEVFTIYNTGKIDRDKLQYKMDITAYIQNMLMTDDKKDADMLKDLWIFPMLSEYNESLSRYVYEVDNASCSRAILNGSLSERAPKLEIVYSVLNMNPESAEGNEK